MFYLYKSIDFSSDLETVEAVILERLKQYNLSSALQYDTEEFNYHDRISHLFLCIIAIDFPCFKDSFMDGEIRLFRERLKNAKSSEIKKALSEASEYLSDLLESEECEKLNSVSSNKIRLVHYIIQAILSKTRHSLGKSHPVNCHKYKLTLPFTFPLKMVAKREVEVKNGKVSIPCGQWIKLFDLIFELLLKIEYLLMANCDDLKKKIYEGEDDRLRQIIKRCIKFINGNLILKGGISRSNKIDKDSLYFPPCMAGLHQILRRSHRLSYASRFQYTLFLKDIGLPVEENISFWRSEYQKPQAGSCCTHNWQENEKRYTYQIKHVYGLTGSHARKTSHPCGTFIQELQSKMDGGCPFQHLTPKQLREALPKSVLAVPDVEDIFKCKSEGLPQKACAQYLMCLKKVVRKKRHSFTEVEENEKLFSIVSPLQFYRLAKSFSMSSSEKTTGFQTNANRNQHLQTGANGFPQNLSFSGSETDVSTSNENLSHEERYVIRHTARQEPQGQENLAATNSNRSSLKQGELGSNRSSLDVSTCSYNTLIIHNADESWAGRLSGIRDGNNVSENNSPRHSHVQGDSSKASVLQKGSNSPSPSLSSGKDRTSYDGNGRLHFDPGVRDITDIPDDYLNQSQVLKHLAKEVKVPSSSLVEESPDPLSEHKRHSLSRKENSPPEYPGGKFFESSPSTVLMQRCKNNKREKTHLSKSQPDLSKIGVGRPKTKGREEFVEGGKKWAEMVNSLAQENTRLKAELETYMQKVAKTQKLEQEISKVHRAQEELIQSSERRGRLEREARTRLQNDCRRLQETNRSLRDQIEVLSSQLLSTRIPSGDTPDALRRELSSRDILIAQLITQNKELVASKERQEIELAAQRATLQEQRTHIDILDTALTNAQENVVRLEEECRKKQMYVELVAQLKSALATQQQASSRREQTEHKLRLQLEGELRAERAKNTGTDSSSGLGSSSNGSNSSATPIGDSSPELKRKLREREELIMRLEGEVAKWEQRYLEESALRQAAIDAASLPKDAKIAALEKTSQETEKLIAEARSEKIRHMDEVHAAQKKVADLESRLKDLESKLAERDAMIKVLQKHTYDKDVSASYPSIALGRSPHHTPHGSLNTDLLGASVSREELGPGAGVFSTVSSVLTSSTGFTSYSGCGDSTSKLFHPGSYHPATSASFNPGTSLSCNDAGSKLGYHAGDSSSKLSFGGDSSSKLSFHGGDSTNKIGYTSYRGKFGTNQSFDDTKKSLDDQLKELDSQLDSQLLSKRSWRRSLSTRPIRRIKADREVVSDRRNRGLCCFPGFSNPSTTPRKGKISQPLLAGVVGLESAGGFLGGLVRSDQQSRPEEILLLEKQGRSSQRQRMSEPERAGSLPPSSLPRPRRSRERKLGEYGRLSDGEATRKTSTNSSGSEDHVISKTPPRPPTQPKMDFPRFPEIRKGSNDSAKIDFARFGDARKTPPLEPSGFPRFDTRKKSGSESPSKVEYTRLVDAQKSTSLDSQSKLHFNRYSDSRKSPPVETSQKNSAKKSFIPHPRKLGEYGRLNDGKGTSLRASTDSTPSSRGPRDSGASGSGDSATGVSTSSEQSKVRLFSPSPTRRGSSLSRETPSSGKYRIQF